MSKQDYLLNWFNYFVDDGGVQTHNLNEGTNVEDYVSEITLAEIQELFDDYADYCEQQEYQQLKA